MRCCVCHCIAEPPAPIQPAYPSLPLPSFKPWYSLQPALPKCVVRVRARPVIAIGTTPACASRVPSSLKRRKPPSLTFPLSLPVPLPFDLSVRGTMPPSTMVAATSASARAEACTLADRISALRHFALFIVLVTEPSAPPVPVPPLEARALTLPPAGPATTQAPSAQEAPPSSVPAVLSS